MIEIFYLIFLLLISLALGQRILKHIRVKFDSNAEDLIFSLPLGLAVLAYMTFFIGVAGLLYKSVLTFLLIIIFIIMLTDIKNILLALFYSIKKFNLVRFIKKFKTKLDFFSVLQIFLLTLILLNFIAAFSPPWHYDVLAYHLAMEKIYIKSHQIIYLPYLFFSNFPSLVETIYLIGLLLKNGILSNLIGYSLGIVFVLAIYSFCRRFFNLKIAILASLIFYSFPMVFMLARTSHIDVQFALFIFLSLYGLFAYFSSKDNNWLILCAIFAGLGVSSKIFGAVAVFGLLVLLFFHLISALFKKEIHFKSLIFNLSVFCLIALIVVSPWLIKIYAYTGNPVWPALNGVFHGKYWNQHHQEDLAKMINLRKPTIMNYLRLPWDIQTQMGKSIGNIDEDLEIGPFFLAILPLYFILRKKDKIINLMFLLLLIYITIWFFLSHILRYIIFAAPLIAIISAYAIFELLKNKYISKILIILLLFTFSFNLLFWMGANAKEIPVSIGLESEDSFYSKYPGAIYKASKFINANLPENSKILLFRDTRGFFLDRDYVWGDPLFQLYIDYSKLNDEDGFYNELKKIGVTHILVNNRFRWNNVLQDVIVNDYRYNKRVMDLKDKLLGKYTKNIYNSDDVLVNELK